jgi:hypothetical protein
MNWIENILDFLRNGPSGGKLDMNALFLGALDMNLVDKDKAVREINALIRWQMARKKWHNDKTRQKMASGGNNNDDAVGGLAATFKPGDFGLNAMDLQDLDLADEDDEESDSEEDDEGDPIEAERKRRVRQRDLLKRSAGEPVKPVIVELPKMGEQLHHFAESFVEMLGVTLVDPRGRACVLEQAKLLSRV